MKTRPLLFRGWRLLLSAVLPALVAAHACAIDLLVYNNNNSGPGSLRQAINDNNALGGGNTITFSNTVTGTITLTSGELIVTTNVTILGPGPDVLAVSGNNAGRVFRVTNAVANISGLSIVNGLATSVPGGGVWNASTLTLSNCAVANCSGGGIFNQGTLSLFDSTVRNNSSAFSSGGIMNLGVSFTAVRSSVISNTCSSVFVIYAAGIFGGGAISNSTVARNASSEQNHPAINGQVSLWNSTVANNVGGGINGGGMVGNSIIAGNGSDVSGSFTSAGYNLIGRTNFSSGWGAVGDQLGTTASPLNPNLLPLGYYGGPTPTLPPAPGSPAIDQGKSFGLTTDQRGRVRPFTNAVPPATLGDHSDIGAVEVGIGINLLVTNSNDSGPGSLRQAILDASPIEKDNVAFAANVTNTIALTSGEIVLNKITEIIGPTNRALTVSGNNSSRIFHVTDGINVISNLTIANGLSTDGGGILADGGNLDLLNCQIVSNATTSVGFESGGGISVRNNAFLNLYTSSVTHNQAYFGGGGMVQSHTAQVSIHSSTIASNRTTFVFDGLFTPQGGGIWMSDGTLTVFNSTIAGNHSTYYGGGICNGVFSSGTADIRGSIIAANTSVNVGPDALGPFTSGGYNLVGNASGSTGFTNTTDQAGVNPMLGPLANYGGPTLTMALRSGSPAIDKGRNFAQLSDQRGFARSVDDPSIANASGGDWTDIGAYEADPGFRIVDIRRSGNDVALSLMTMLGRTYRAEYAPDLDSTFWPVFTNDVSGNGHLVWVTNFGGANQPRRFYRAGNSLD